MELGAVNQSVSIIIRTKNEGRWIVSCLESVFRQEYGKVEVVIVDNNSEDGTLDLAQRFPVKVVNVDEYKPGLAINKGIRASSGDIIVLLSGHCIPVTNDWLVRLIRPLSDSVLGVYGRQEPLSFSSDIDKRDLLTVFGLDPKVQEKDPFFHNANSCFLRQTWEKFKFDETVSNIEDRVWGQQIIQAGFKLAYEPDASVYHWHGIHQDLDADRAKGVVRVMESVSNIPLGSVVEAAKTPKVLGIIPVRGEPINFGNHLPLRRAIRAMKCSQYVTSITVATDNFVAERVAEEEGVSFIKRDVSLSSLHVGLLDVLDYTLGVCDPTMAKYDLVCSVDETYVFRPANLIDALVLNLMDNGLDISLAGTKESRSLWFESEYDVNRILDGFVPSAMRSSSAHVGMPGLGMVVHTSVLRNLLGREKRFGVLEIDAGYVGVKVESEGQIEEILSSVEEMTSYAKSYIE